METKKLVCVGCPLGCNLEMDLEEGRVIEVRGNTCVKGEEYARQEAICPMRILTTTVKVNGGELPVLPCITSRDIPLSKMMDAMKEIRKLSVNAPVEEGAVLLENLAGTGVSLLASCSMKKG